MFRGLPLLKFKSAFVTPGHRVDFLIPIVLIFFSIFQGCSVGHDGSCNFAFNISSGNPFMYNGSVMTPSPSFSVYKLQVPLTINPSISDSVSLQAFGDAKCTHTAQGTFTVNSNPEALVQGIANFSSVSYTLPIGTSSEGLIYLKGSLVNSGVSVCSVPISVIQHFNFGKGYVSPGPGASAGAASAQDAAATVRIDSTGRYIVAGTSKNLAGDQVMTLWRYFPNGNLDTSFNSIGNLPGSVSESGSAAGRASGQGVDSVSDLLIDSSGKYLVLGWSKDNSGTPNQVVTLWRYNSDGTVDTTFGLAASGVYTQLSLTGRTSPFTDQPKAMQLDGTSSIVVTGQSQDASNGREAFIARIKPNGTALDTTFHAAGPIPGVWASGTTGAAGAFGANESDSGNSIQIDSQGRFVVAGSSVDSALPARTRLSIWRFLSTGNLDTSFVGSGILLSGTAGAAGGTGVNLSDVGNSLQIDSSGNYVIAGSSKNSSGGTEMALWKYSSQGVLDSSFNGGSPLHLTQGAGGDGATGAGIRDQAYSLVIDTLNSVYAVGGSSQLLASGTVASIWRFNLDGTMSTLFNSRGIATTSIVGAIGGMSASTVKDSSVSVQVDQVGTYILVGSSASAGASQMAVWRYLMLGVLDQ